MLEVWIGVCSLLNVCLMVLKLLEWSVWLSFFYFFVCTSCYMLEVWIGCCIYPPKKKVWIGCRGWIGNDCDCICLTCLTGILFWLFLSSIMLQSKGQWCLHLPKSELNSNIQGKKEKTKKTFYIKIFSYCWGSILVASLFVSLVSLKPIIVVIHEERKKMLLMCSRQFFYVDWVEL